mmetsp:Transcript_15641/g.45766  ORF Transcript_15641/g.45766 Transcript_15641/m.45766 type:complete len:288 (+) Transcript_15641:2626-3489(+)
MAGDREVHSRSSGTAAELQVVRGVARAGGKEHPEHQSVKAVGLERRVLYLDDRLVVLRRNAVGRRDAQVRGRVGPGLEAAAARRPDLPDEVVAQARKLLHVLGALRIPAAETRAREPEGELAALLDLQQAKVQQLPHARLQLPLLAAVLLEEQPRVDLVALALDVEGEGLLATLDRAHDVEVVELLLRGGEKDLHWAGSAGPHDGAHRRHREYGILALGLKARAAEGAAEGDVLLVHNVHSLPAPGPQQQPLKVDAGAVQANAWLLDRAHEREPLHHLLGWDGEGPE